MVKDSSIINMKEVVKKKKEVIVSNDLSKKISNKKYSLQFLPTCFDSIKDLKTITYKGEKLKTSYLVDIVNGLILKYYFKKENKYVLNATILKDRYGYLYNYYINYLVETGILKMINNYRKGKSSRIYSLNEKIFTNKISRYKNEDKVLLKKYKKKIFDTVELTDDEINLISPEIKQKLISDLFDVKIEMERSIFFLDILKDKDIDMYNRNLYSVDCINNGHIFYHFDSYGRMHTNYTILRAFIRKNCLLIDGERTSEIDISNSQPLFLTKLINDSKSNWINKEEFDLFKELTMNGKYYEYVKHVLNIEERSDVKEMTYKVLFGRNASNSKADKLFKSIFPTIHRFIQLYKKENGDYKVLAYKLQKMESDLIFNKIIRKIMSTNPDIKVITVHDSIVIPKKYKDEVNAIFQTEILKEFNF
jgi:hypothetical protein